MGKLVGLRRKCRVRRYVRVAGLLVKASVMLLYILWKYLHQKLRFSQVKLIVLSEDMIMPFEEKSHMGSCHVASWNVQKKWLP